jgi:ABC-type transport system involved in multi-copper enzyme maturation permease subunit
MSVYKHNYRAYSGRVTPLWNRVWVLARYGLAEVWSSKITISLFTLSLLPFLGFLFVIYLANNPLALALISRSRQDVFEIGPAFFLRVLESQCWIALVFTSWIAPRLVTFDLADNSLPILLSHPISRFGYVFGKFIALFASLSTVTWIPGLLLFAYQGYSSPTPWAARNFSVAFGIFAGTVIWTALVSLLGLAFSSWVKWRVVATGVIFAAVFVPAGVGGMISAILHTKWGLLLDLPIMMTELWQRLLGAPEMFDANFSVPTVAIVAMLALAGLLFVAMLNARIRAREVVRG